ncbi:hypothetical protein DM02DRAFT_83466 [Periconia macrospinosa]|uniref:Protein kinase domain-containing protein n=1 Tax=Periconia macrospinosa TaxID=97972 RepID=A0A2V1E8G0_9PLEO|nr:hypothetical protein DM02DRAFT_83466 [Periconia macrospinosa]
MAHTSVLDHSLSPRRTRATAHTPNIIMQDHNPPPHAAPPDIQIHPPTGEQYSKAQTQYVNFNDDACSSSSLSSLSSYASALEDQDETPPTETQQGQGESPLGVVDEYSDPTPPTHLFRTVRKLHTRNGIATWLCLPRELRSLCERTSHNAQAYSINIVRILKKASFVQAKRDRDLEHIAQLVIVKTSVDPSVLRRHGDLLECLHLAPVGLPGAAPTSRFHSQSFIGSYLLRQQLTGNPRSSWLCVRPHFGRPLNEFGWWHYQFGQRAVPAWFVWHIFLSVFSALGIAHEKGIANNNVTLENIVLNPYPVHGPNSFRNWPDVVLVDFSQATSLNDESARNDTRGLLQVVRHVVDVYTLTRKTPTKQSATTQVDPLALFSSFAGSIVDNDRKEDLDMAVVKSKWQGIAVFQRENGPTKFPDEMMVYAGSQLIDAGGLGRARGLVLNQFGNQAESFRDLARARPEQGLVVFEKKKEMTAEGRDITRALCIVKFPKKKHLLGDVERIRGYLKKEAKSEYIEDNMDRS